MTFSVLDVDVREIVSTKILRIAFRFCNICYISQTFIYGEIGRERKKEIERERGMEIEREK